MSVLVCKVSEDIRSISLSFCFLLQVVRSLGPLLKPTSQVHGQGTQFHNGGKLLTNDLDSSLANLVGSRSFIHVAFFIFTIVFFISCLIKLVVFLIDLHFGAPLAKK